MALRIVTFIVALFALHVVVYAENYDCEAGFDKAENCFQDLMLVSKHFSWSKDSFQGLCNTEFNAIACIQEYKTKCITGMVSMVFNLLSQKFNSTFNGLCKNEDAMDEFLEHFNCVKDHLVSDASKRCVASYQLEIELVDKVTKEQKFPIICCSFHEIKDCVGKELRKGCKNEKSIEYMNNMVNKFVGDLNKMFCAEWKNLDNCYAKLPKSILVDFNRIKAMDLETAEKSKKYKSFLRLLKHLIESANQ